MPSGQTFLAGAALAFLGALAVMMSWHKVPSENHDFIVFILGTLAGAITVGGANKMASTKSGDVTVNPTPEKPDGV